MNLALKKLKNWQSAFHVHHSRSPCRFLHRYFRPVTFNFHIGIDPLTLRFKDYSAKISDYGYGSKEFPHHISIEDDILLEPATEIVEKMDDADPEILENLRNAFERRPVLTKISLFDGWSNEEKMKVDRLLPLIAFHYISGPFKNCWIRYGYDPRVKSESHQYQVIDFRNLYNPRELKRGRQDKDKSDIELREGLNSIFDGKKPGNNFIRFQVCDILDSKVKSILFNAANLRSEFDKQDGWYCEGVIRKVRNLMKEIWFDMRGNEQDNWFDMMDKLISEIPDESIEHYDEEYSLLEDD